MARRFVCHPVFLSAVESQSRGVNNIPRFSLCGIATGVTSEVVPGAQGHGVTNATVIGCGEAMLKLLFSVYFIKFNQL